MEHEILIDLRNEMGAVLDVVGEDLATVKTGRAKPSLVEQVQIPAYNTRMPLIELATISSPDPQLLIIQPWDESIIQDISKGILQSGLGLTPAVDGTLIRLAIPPLTEERREEYVKLVHQKIESGRGLLRQARQDAKKRIEDLKGQPGISEDDVFELLSQMEKVTDEFMGKVGSMGQEKEQELRTI